MSETTGVFAETYKMYDERLAAFSDRWKDVVVLGARPEDCRLRSVEAFGRTWRLSLAGEMVEVPPEGFAEVVSAPDEMGMRSVSYRVPWTDASLAVVAAPIAPERLDHWFAGCWNLREVRGLGLLDTSCARSMRGTFLGCEALAELDVSGFDTSRVEDMRNLFWGCSSLLALDVSGFDTARVETMGGMFHGCSSLASLDVSGFDTSRVTSMTNLFCGCSALTELDVSGFDTSRAEQMSGMFWGCSSLRELDLAGFDLSRVTSLFFLFRGCSSLAALRMPGIDPARADEVRMGAMFEGADALGDTPEHLAELVRSGAGVAVGRTRRA